MNLIFFIAFFNFFFCPIIKFYDFIYFAFKYDYHGIMIESKILHLDPCRVEWSFFYHLFNYTIGTPFLSIHTTSLYPNPKIIKEFWYIYDIAIHHPQPCQRSFQASFLSNQTLPEAYRSTTLVFNQFYKKAILENRLVNHKKEKAAKPHTTQTSRVVVALPN